MLHLPSNRENNEILVTSQHTVFIRFGTRGAYFDTLGGLAYWEEALNKLIGLK